MKWILLALLLTIQVAVAETFYPANIFILDKKFSHHVAIVEKSTHTLYLYGQEDSRPKLIKKYQIATGKFSGDKYEEGDRRTPEGVYLLQTFLADQKLVKMYGEKQAKIYGAGAFTSNYPNVIDRRKGKSGGGIWIHSTDDNSRITKGLDSRGCVVVVDEDLKDLSQYVDLGNTPLVIVQNLHFLNEKTWLEQKEKLLSLVTTWQEAWRSKEFSQYINSYAPEKFSDPRKGRYTAFKSYKRAVFARNDNPLIKFDHLSILAYGNYAVVQMQQDYTSEVIDDIGKKTLYLQKNRNYDWKIVAEQWKKLDLESKNIAFTPAMRFFKN